MLLFTLTVAGLDPEPCRGAVRDCLQRLRVPCPGLRYFWWAEFQRRGALHYHGILIDPPFDFGRDARDWFDQHWPHAEIQTWVEWRSAAWFRSSAGAYALKDVRKVGGKRYEQQYDRMPRSWRTYSCHRLAFAPEIHAQHENRLYLGWDRVEKEPYVVAMDVHVPAAAGCVLHGPRRRPGRANRVATRRKMWKLLNRREARATGPPVALKQ